MSDTQNTDQTGSNAFSTQTQATQTNPFTADLKGEFTSEFGNNTNAVSQMFKNGGFGGMDRNRMILIGVVVVALVAAGVLILTEPGDESISVVEPQAQVEQEGAGEEQGDLAAGDEGAQEAGAKGDGAFDEFDEGEDDVFAEDGAAAEGGEAATEEFASGAGQSMATPSSGAISLVTPGDGANVSYDETQGPAVFQWDGPADRIIFSHSSSMTPVNRVIPLNGANSYAFLHPYPGTWYWQVENGDGRSEARRFIVNPPIRRNIAMTEPQNGGAVAGTGGVVAWTADQKVARYRVWLVPTGSSWANPPYRFGTTGTKLALQNVPAGQYDLRVGAFSEVSGRWEWQQPVTVTVQ